MTEQVECHSGHEYAQRPTALHREGTRLEVQAVEAEWRAPDGKGFRVRTADGQVFELFYHRADDEWSIQLVE